MKKPLNSNKTNHQSGLDAEELAKEYLSQKGYKILEERYKTKHGEIDIIIEQGGLLAFVEIKKRKSFGFDDPVSQTQKNRICNAALQYISENSQINYADMRFDCILIDSTNSLTHIEDSWRSEL